MAVEWILIGIYILRKINPTLANKAEKLVLIYSSTKLNEMMFKRYPKNHYSILQLRRQGIEVI